MKLRPKSYSTSCARFGKAGLELLGIYHSHPNSDNQPSRATSSEPIIPTRRISFFHTRANALGTNSRFFDSRRQVDGSQDPGRLILFEC